MECKLLNFEYINSHKDLFSSLPDFEIKYKNMEKESIRYSAGCSECIRKSLEKDFERFVIQKIMEHKRKDILRKLDPDMVLRYDRLYRIRELL